VRETEGAAMTSRRRVAAHQRADASRIDSADGREVDDEMTIALGDSRLNGMFEFFSRAAFDQRLMRRQHEAGGAVPNALRGDGRIDRGTHRAAAEIYTERGSAHPIQSVAATDRDA
jgi:hypothetical protein